eukprot:gene1453-biopygen15353
MWERGAAGVTTDGIYEKHGGRGKHEALQAPPKKKKRTQENTIFMRFHPGLRLCNPTQCSPSQLGSPRRHLTKSDRTGLD